MLKYILHGHVKNQWWFLNYLKDFPKCMNIKFDFYIHWLTYKLNIKLIISCTPNELQLHLYSLAAHELVIVLVKTWRYLVHCVGDRTLILLLSQINILYDQINPVGWNHEIVLLSWIYVILIMILLLNLNIKSKLVN